ncbi:hypothetical protein [unidentified bacterial endosymbiont]|uniref:hypothetical protein n=1 Tax=unidentified bacterial endosymbiont TaxID=2355 RepID=UPI0020A20EFE|nr:hypothetical protein [unidentified bacterial endosymbiont]
MLLIVYISGLLLIARYVEQNVDERSATAAAQQLQAVSQQAQQLVSERWPLILQHLENQYKNTPPPNDPCFHELPTELLDAIDQNDNPYQQGYRILLHSAAAGRWQLWVHTQDGRPIPKRAWLRISTPLGILSGYTMSDRIKGPIIRGQQNLWSLRWPTGLKSPGEGHLVTRHDLNQLALTSADCLLYRKAIKGTPQLNQMQTSLDLQGNQIIFNQGSSVGPQQWLLKKDQNSLRATLRNSKSLPRFNLIDLEDNQVILNSTAISTLYSLPFGCDIRKVADKHFIYQKEEQKWVANFRRGNTQQSISTPTTLKKSSQLHCFWNQLPCHPLIEKYSKKPQSFADKLCQDNSEAFSALGRLFIAVPTQDSNNLLFICGKEKKGSPNSLKAYAFETFHYGPPIPLLFDRPEFLIELPEKLSEKLPDKNVETVYQFTKDTIERKLYFFYAIDAYNRYDSLGDQSDKEIKKSFETLFNPVNKRLNYKVSDETIDSILKRLNSLFSHNYLKKNEYFIQCTKNNKKYPSAHYATLKHIYEEINTYKENEKYKNFTTKYNTTRKTLFNEFLTQLKTFNRTKTQSTHPEENKHINKLILNCFEKEKDLKTFPSIIKYPIGINLQEKITTDEEYGKILSFLKEGTKNIHSIPELKDSPFNDLSNQINDNYIGKIELEKFKESVLKDNKLYTFVTSLSSFEEFEQNYKKNIKDKKTANSIKWELIDLVLKEATPSPIQLKFLGDEPPVDDYSNSVDESSASDTRLGTDSSSPSGEQLSIDEPPVDDYSKSVDESSASDTRLGTDSSSPSGEQLSIDEPPVDDYSNSIDESSASDNPLSEGTPSPSGEQLSIDEPPVDDYSKNVDESSASDNPLSEGTPSPSGEQLSIDEPPVDDHSKSVDESSASDNPLSEGTPSPSGEQLSIDEPPVDDHSNSVDDDSKIIDDYDDYQSIDDDCRSEDDSLSNHHSAE